jgi:Arc/MetJ-type ribon-helix-helix transcriptional regulator
MVQKQQKVTHGLRYGAELNNRIEPAAKQGVFSSRSAFIRSAIERESAGRESDVDAAEQRIAASLDRMAREIRNLRLGLVKVVLLPAVQSGRNLTANGRMFVGAEPTALSRLGEKTVYVKADIRARTAILCACFFLYPSSHYGRLFETQYYDEQEGHP